MAGLKGVTKASPECGGLVLARKRWGILATLSFCLRNHPFLLLFALGPVVAGCQPDRSFGPVSAYSAPLERYTDALPLQRGDQLKIVVYGEEALSGVYDVDPNGAITMPLVGPIRVAGKNRNQIEKIIARTYADRNLLLDPRVTVADVSYRPIFLLGEVEHPGKYPYAAGLDVLTAVATAGGFTFRASKTSVFIRHSQDEFWQEYSLAEPLPLGPGDLIRVPERYF